MFSKRLTDSRNTSSYFKPAKRLARLPIWRRVHFCSAVTWCSSTHLMLCWNEGSCLNLLCLLCVLSLRQKQQLVAVDKSQSSKWGNTTALMGFVCLNRAVQCSTKLCTFCESHQDDCSSDRSEEGVSAPQTSMTMSKQNNSSQKCRKEMWKWDC